jgi:hypothetical protein
LLRQHIDFLIDRHSHFSSSSSENPVLPEDPFSIEWTREALRAAVAKGVHHITQVGLSRIPFYWHLNIHYLYQGHLLWEALRDWELDSLSTVLSDERSALHLRSPSVHSQELLCQVCGHRGDRRHVPGASPTVPF